MATANGRNGHVPTLTPPPPTYALNSEQIAFEREKLYVTRDLITNVLASRQEWLRRMGGMDPRRSIYDECGFPVNPGPRDYQDLYDREGVATRVVEVLPKETWQVQPEIYELEDSEEPTPFEQAWDAVGRGLRGEQSYYKDEKGNPVWEYLLRLDVLSRIGRFGVLLLGVDDGRPLYEPVEGIDEENSMEMGVETDPETGAIIEEEDAEGKKRPKVKKPDFGANIFTRNTENKKTVRIPLYKLTFNALEEDDGEEVPDESAPLKPGAAAGPDAPEEGEATDPFGEESKGPPKTKRQLTYLRVFPESLVSITRFEANPTSPRFGYPLIYQITLNDISDNTGGVGLPLGTYDVHWTRIVHAADNLKSSEVYSAPSMRPVLNYILSLQKIYGASAEGYWKASIAKIFMTTHPQLGGDVDVNLEQLKDMMERMENSLQKWAFTPGLTPQTSPPEVVDPTPHKDTLIEAICITLGIPVRVFKGSERGELASTQDDDAWNDRLRQRQDNYVTPRIVIPFVDRLIQIGCLPKPEARPVEEPKPLTAAIDPETGEPLPGKRVNPVTGEPMEPVMGSEDELLEDDEALLEEEEEPKSLVPVGNLATEEQTPGGGKPQSERLSDLFRQGTEAQYGATTFGFIGSGGAAPGSSGERKAIDSELGYCVEWPDLTSRSENEKADVLLKKTNAYAQFIQSGMNTMVPEQDYMTKFDDMDEEEAQAIFDAASTAAVEREAEDIAKQQALIDKGLAPDPLVDQDIKMEAAKHGAPDPTMGGPPGAGGGFPPKPGGGGKPPFPPKGGKPTFNSAFDLRSKAIKAALVFNRYDLVKAVCELPETTLNAFCATGDGGGQDNSCSSGEGSGGGGGGDDDLGTEKFTHDTAAAKIKAAIDRDHKSPLRERAGAVERVKPLLAKLKSDLSGEELRALAKKVTGKAGRKKDGSDSLKLIEDDATAVSRLLESQMV